MSALANAQHVLAIYAERVESALAAFRTGEIDLAFAALQRMNEAFHNYKAQETLALQSGFDPLANEAMSTLWQQISADHQDLIVEIEQAKAQSAELLTRIAAARRKVASFHSGYQGHHKFEKSA